MTSTDWLVTGVMIASGIAASLHVGKVPPALPGVARRSRPRARPAGWVASIFNLMGATLGVASGLVADRIGAPPRPRRRPRLPRRRIDLGRHRRFGRRPARDPRNRRTRPCSPSPSPPPDHRRRHGPARPRARTRRMEHLLPTGMAIGMLSAPFVLPGFGWRGLWLLHAGVGAAVLLIVPGRHPENIRAPERAPRHRRRGVAPPRPVAARRRVRLLHDPVLRGGDLATDVPRGIARQHAGGGGARRCARGRRQRARLSGRRLAASPRGRPLEAARRRLPRHGSVRGRGLLGIRPTRDQGRVRDGLQRGRRPAARRHPRRRLRPCAEPRPRRHRQRIHRAGLTTPASSPVRRSSQCSWPPWELGRGLDPRRRLRPRRPRR